MKRKELLEAGLTEEKNVTTVVTKTIKEDSKFLTRAKRDLEDKIQDLEDQLENRLSSQTALDKSVIESLFNSIKENKTTLELYKEFEKTYITE